MYYVYLFTLSAVLISFFLDRNKTFKALKISWKKFSVILPAFSIMLILVSITLYLIPDSMIVRFLGNNNKTAGTIIASLFGSITLMPGFIAYPLCGILLKKGVSYMVLAAFSTTLMMVGFVTFPIEKAYFGTKVTIMRNCLSFLIALVVAVAVGAFYGELI